MTKTEFFKLLNRVAYPRKLGKSPSLNYFDSFGRSSIILTDVQGDAQCLYVPNKGTCRDMDTKCDLAITKFRLWLREWRTGRRHDINEELIQIIVSLCAHTPATGVADRTKTRDAVSIIVGFYNLWRPVNEEPCDRVVIEARVYKALGLDG